MDSFYLTTILGKHSPGTHLIHMQPHELLSEPPTMKEDINIPCNLKYTHTQTDSHWLTELFLCCALQQMSTFVSEHFLVSKHSGGQTQRSDPHGPWLNLLLKTAGWCGLLWENRISSFPATPECWPKPTRFILYIITNIQ